MRLSSTDLVALLGFVHDLYDSRTPSALGAHLCHAIRTLVPADNSTYSELTLGGTRPTAVEYMEPAALNPRAAAVFERFMADHPLIAHYAKTGDGRARKVSDFLTSRQLHNLAFYTEYVRPFFGLEYQMAVAVTARPGRVVGMSLARSTRDFSERDRLLLDLLRPHIVQARRTAERTGRMSAELEAFHRGFEEVPAGLVRVERNGTIHSATTRARSWLRQYFGATTTSDALPDLLQRWMTNQQNAAAPDGETPAPRLPLVRAREGHELSIRMVPDGAGCLLLLEERRVAPNPGPFDDLGLTEREKEVLMWVAAGKANADAATIIGIATRTVEKHLEHIYRKLGVENRTTAANIARDRMGLIRHD